MGASMIRLFHAVAALAASSSFVYGIAPGVQHQEAAARSAIHAAVAPQVIGADKPVFLGRMVVTATPLPAG